MDREYTDEEILEIARRANERWLEALRILAEMRYTDPERHNSV